MQASLTEDTELEVFLGKASLVLCPAGIEASIGLLDLGEVEAVAACLGHLDRGRE